MSCHYPLRNVVLCPNYTKSMIFYDCKASTLTYSHLELCKLYSFSETTMMALRVIEQKKTLYIWKHNGNTYATGKTICFTNKRMKNRELRVNLKIEPQINYCQCRKGSLSFTFSLIFSCKVHLNPVILKPAQTLLSTKS